MGKLNRSVLDKRKARVLLCNPPQSLQNSTGLKMAQGATPAEAETATASDYLQERNGPDHDRLDMVEANLTANRPLVPAEEASAPISPPEDAECTVLECEGPTAKVQEVNSESVRAITELLKEAKITETCCEDYARILVNQGCDSRDKMTPDLLTEGLLLDWKFQQFHCNQLVQWMRAATAAQ